MSYKPEKYNIGDTWQFSDGEKVHSFYLQGKGNDCPDDKESGSIGHAVSDDLIHWKELSPAVKRGEKGSYDENDIWTGCTVEHDGKYYLYYSSRKDTSFLGNSISVAVSDDCVNWVKYENNPVLVPDKRFYCQDDIKTILTIEEQPEKNNAECRDFCVVRDEEKKIWWGFFAARKPANECSNTCCIGLAKSNDLLHWEQLPPCFCPDKYDCVETPDVFKAGDKWYMLCLTGNQYGQRNPTSDPNLFGNITLYAMADKIEGPYHECFEDNVAIGSMYMSGACAKTVLHKGKRYIFYTQSLWQGDRNIENAMSYPKEIDVNKNERLYVKWFSGINSLYTDDIFLHKDNIYNLGKWGSLNEWRFEDNKISVKAKSDVAVKIFDVKTKNFVIETTVQRKDAVSAGVIFDVFADNLYIENRVVLLDYLKNEVWLTKARNYPKINARSFNFEKDSYNLKVLAVGKTIEVYVDDVLTVHYVTERFPGKIGLFAERGEVCFYNSTVHKIADEEL